MVHRGLRRVCCFCRDGMLRMKLLYSFIIGGLLARPQDRWPKLFPGRFWEEYRYFLPCAVTASIVFLSFMLAFLLKEESQIMTGELRTWRPDFLSNRPYHPKETQSTIDPVIPRPMKRKSLRAVESKDHPGRVWTTFLCVRCSFQA